MKAPPCSFEMEPNTLNGPQETFSILNSALDRVHAAIARQLLSRTAKRRCLFILIFVVSKIVIVLPLVSLPSSASLLSPHLL